MKSKLLTSIYSGKIEIPGVLEDFSAGIFEAIQNDLDAFHNTFMFDELAKNVFILKYNFIQEYRKYDKIQRSQGLSFSEFSSYAAFLANLFKYADLLPRFSSFSMKMLYDSTSFVNKIYGVHDTEEADFAAYISYDITYENKLNAMKLKDIFFKVINLNDIELYQPYPSIKYIKLTLDDVKSLFEAILNDKAIFNEYDLETWDVNWPDFCPLTIFNVENDKFPLWKLNFKKWLEGVIYENRNA